MKMLPSLKCEALKWSISKFLSSAKYQLVISTLVMGLGLYVADVGSDWYFVYEAVHNYYHNGGGPSKSPTELKKLYQSWNFIIIILGTTFNLLPGLLRSIRSLFRRKFDLGITKFKLSWKNCILIPAYLLVMPVWSIVIPVFRYWALSKHLWQEVRGKVEEYDPRFLDSVIKERAFEGLAEAGPQILFQSATLHFLYFTEQLDEANILLTLSLMISCVSFLMTVELSQRLNASSNIGRIKAPTYKHQMLFVVFAFFELILRMLLFSRFTEREPVLFMPFLHVGLHLMIFGRHISFAIDGWLSYMVPYNFIRDDVEVTKKYLICHSLLNDFIFFSAELTILYQRPDLDNLRNPLFIWLCTLSFSLTKMTLLLYSHFGLLPLYKDKKHCFPRHKSEIRRRFSFPYNWAKMCSIPLEKLSRTGHFYSDFRKTRTRTTCFSCGQCKKWDSSAQVSIVEPACHLESCSFFNNSMKQCPEDSEAVRCAPTRLSIVKLFFDKSLSLSLIAALLWRANTLNTFQQSTSKELTLTCLYSVTAYWQIGSLFLQYIHTSKEDGVMHNLKTALCNVFNVRGQTTFTMIYDLSAQTVLVLIMLRAKMLTEDVVLYCCTVAFSALLAVNVILFLVTALQKRILAKIPAAESFGLAPI